MHSSTGRPSVSQTSLKQEPIAHQPARLVDEVLALALHRLGLISVVVAERQHAERDVARLVAPSRTR